MEPIRCVFVGKSAVGKSTLLKRAAYDFGPVAPTIGVDNKVFEYKGFYFQCWDCAGGDKFKTVSDIFVQHTQQTIYMYDASRPLTLEVKNIPKGALIVANISAGGAVPDGHVSVDAYDRNSVDALLDLIIERNVVGQRRRPEENRQECCVCC